MNMLEEMRKLKEKVWDNKPWDWGFVAVVNQLEANMDTLLKENAELKARLAEAEAKERSHALIAEQLENAIDCMATAEARLKRAERENAALSAAVDEKIHIAPGDLLATMLARAEEAEAEAARLREYLSNLEIPHYHNCYKRDGQTGKVVLGTCIAACQVRLRDEFLAALTPKQKGENNEPTHQGD